MWQARKEVIRTCPIRTASCSPFLRCSLRVTAYASATGRLLNLLQVYCQPRPSRSSGQPEATLNQTAGPPTCTKCQMASPCGTANTVPPNVVNSCQLSSLPLADVSVHGPYPEGHPNHGMHAMSDGLMMAHQEHGATATTPAADLAVARQTLQYMARFQLATPSNSRPLISTVTACSTTQTKWKMTGSKAELLLAICAHTFRSLQTKA